MTNDEKLRQEQARRRRYARALCPDNYVDQLRWWQDQHPDGEPRDEDQSPFR